MDLMNEEMTKDVMRVGEVLFFLERLAILLYVFGGGNHASIFSTFMLFLITNYTFVCIYCTALTTPTTRKVGSKLLENLPFYVERLAQYAVARHYFSGLGICWYFVVPVFAISNAVLFTRWCKTTMTSISTNKRVNGLREEDSMSKKEVAKTPETPKEDIKNTNDTCCNEQQKEENQEEEEMESLVGSNVELKKYMEETSDLSSKLNFINNFLQNVDERIQFADEHENKYAEEKRIMSSKLESAYNSVDSYQAKVKELAEEKEELEMEITSLREKLNDAETYQEEREKELEIENTFLREKLNDAETYQEKWENELAEQNGKLKMEITSLREKLNDAETYQEEKEEELEMEITSLEEKLNDAKKKEKELAEQKGKLEMDVISLKIKLCGAEFYQERERESVEEKQKLKMEVISLKERKDDANSDSNTRELREEIVELRRKLMVESSTAKLLETLAMEAQDKLSRLEDDKTGLADKLRETKALAHLYRDYVQDLYYYSLAKKQIEDLGPFSCLRT